ncbi:hypothetical protein RMATCC62417_13294 [Rhizopus microsporus]|nr:hypothetical protein RMATCC62417_13294 [Rhizopus microsporus]
MISAIHWIRKGAPAQHPKKYDLNDEEYARISKLAAEQLEDAKEELKAATDNSMEVDNAGVRQAFQHQALASVPTVEEKKPVTTADDDEEDDDDEEEESLPMVENDEEDEEEEEDDDDAMED